MGKRSIRFAAAALAGVLAAFVAPTRPAEACSCVGLSAAAYMKGADLVFLGRAGKEVTRGESTVQPLAVLHALKGKPGTTYSLERKVLSPCERHYDEGEVAIVFVSGGAVGLCSGNFALSLQAKDLPEYFAHAEPKTGRPSRAAVERALKEALAGYLHDRPRIDVAYPRLAGKSFRVEKTELRFVKRPGPHGVKLREAVTSGPIHFVAGGYDDEGLVFEIVLHETKKGFDVLGAFVAER